MMLDFLWKGRLDTCQLFISIIAYFIGLFFTKDKITIQKITHLSIYPDKEVGIIF